jgi:serine/threonine protein kinase
VRQGDQLNGWTLLERLGRGGNAEVWLAEQEDAKAAVKVLRRAEADRLARFRDEIAFLLSGDPGPGVLPLIDHSLPDSPILPPWYAMPVARPLEEALGEEPSAYDVVSAVAEIAETLARLAARGIGHRDIKPANLYELEGAYLVGDFGLATYPEKEPLTRSGRRLGPIDYMAAEMREDADTAAAEPADAYSLSKTLWVMLTGRSLPLPGPHRVDDEAYSLRTYLADTHASELDLLLEHATRHDPSARPSMAEIATELRAWLTRPSNANHDPNVDTMAREIRSLTEPDRRANERRGEQRRLANAALEDLKSKGLAVIHDDYLGRISGLQTGYDSGSAYRLIVSPEYREPPGTIHSVGWQSVAQSVGAHPVYLLSAVGVELTEDAQIQLTAAYGLERYLPADHERRTVWAEQRTTSLGSAAQRIAVDWLTTEMLRRFDEALREFTRWLRERPTS